jgi:hypothetical protein
MPDPEPQPAPKPSPKPSPRPARRRGPPRSGRAAPKKRTTGAPAGSAAAAAAGTSAAAGRNRAVKQEAEGRGAKRAGQGNVPAEQKPAGNEEVVDLTKVRGVQVVQLCAGRDACHRLQACAAGQTSSPVQHAQQHTPTAVRLVDMLQPSCNSSTRLHHSTSTGSTSLRRDGWCCLPLCLQPR